jgi:KDO2-lipid IV(A) lauroyltransferase
MYYVIYPLLYLLSLLPFFVLYGFSDVLAFLLYHVFRYRRDVVFDNLLIAFPEKSISERKEIAKKFYRYFTDSMVEIVKLISLSREQLQKRMTCNFDVVNELLGKGKSVYFLCGHQFNWEYANLLCSSGLNVPFVTVYLPIGSKAFDRIMLRIRSRFGAILVNPNSFGTRMHNIFRSQHVLVLAADQSPATPRSGYWIHFFGRPTVFLPGPEKSAVRNKVAVVFFGFKKRNRGHYQLEITLLTEDASKLSERGELICLYRDELERAIREDPANYLWSHRRFKFTWQPAYGKIMEITKR